jgi:hypothetical protein
MTTKKKNTAKGKKVEKKLDIPEDVWDNGPCLSEGEMLRLKDNGHKFRVFKLELESLRLKSELLETKSILENARAALCHRDVLDKQRAYGDAQKSHAKFENELRLKYNITSTNWGYNPLTGEIDESEPKEEE